jgi:hypothetical protein
MNRVHQSTSLDGRYMRLFFMSNSVTMLLNNGIRLFFNSHYFEQILTDCLKLPRSVFNVVLFPIISNSQYTVIFSVTSVG